MINGPDMLKVIRRVLNLLNFVFSISAIATLIWFHGYRYVPGQMQPHMKYLLITFSFYIVQFVARAFMTGRAGEYVSRNKLEASLFVLLGVEVLFKVLFDISVLRGALAIMNIGQSSMLYVLTLHIVLLLICGIELGKATTRSTIWKLPPPILFILSFLVLVVVGSSMLMLPEMTTMEGSMPFTDALFTSISANCVTGLTVVDTATYFSFKGKVLIMVLIQLGGLNIIAFATYFISFFRRRIQTPQHVMVVEEILHTGKLEDSGKLIKTVVTTTLVIEFIGTYVLYRQWGDGMNFANHGEQLFYSVFHAISAFNNAGFTLFTEGLTNASVGANWSVHITIAALIVLGGLGFTALMDVYQRVRPRNTVARLPLQTRIVLYSSLGLIVLGAVGFMVLEKDRSLSGLTESGQWVTSFFQSVTTRTAGFNTVDIAMLTPVTIALIIMLMFIGASPGSTGGGIKTSTFTVLVLAVFRRKSARGRELVISHFLMKKAITITLYALAVVCVGFILLVLLEKDTEPVALLFEEVSAFSTVGLSTGITSGLSGAGKVVIMSTMFIGRIGPLALTYVLFNSKPMRDTNPDQSVILG